MRTRKSNTTLPLFGSLVAAIVVSLTVNGAARSEDVTPIATIKHEGPVDFAKEVLPILRRNCLACHNQTDAESDLVLENPQAMLKGGIEGPAVVAGKATESLLLKLTTGEEEPLMPPEDNDVGAKRLSPEELGLIQLWIDEGAKGDAGESDGPLSWQPLPIGVNPIYAVAVSPDGQYVAAGRANQIFLYHVPSKRPVGRLTDPSLLESGVYSKSGVAHLDLVQSLRFSPDSELLASGGYRTVKFWKRARNARKLEIAGLESGPRSVAVSSDGKYAAVGEESGAIKLVEMSSGKIAKSLLGHTGAVHGLCFTRDGSKLVSGGEDKTLRMWNVADGAALGNLETPAPVNAVAFVLEDSQVATGGADSMIRIWALPAAQPMEEPTEGSKEESKETSENGDPEADQPATEEKPAKEEPAKEEPAKEEEEPAAEPPKPLKELKGHGGPITSLVSIPPTAGQLLSGSQDSTIRVWDIAGSKQIRSMNHGGPVNSVAVRPDGTRFASAGSNNLSKLWDASNGKQVAELRGDFRTKIKVEDVTRAVKIAKRIIDGTKADLKAVNDRKAAEEKNATSAEEARKKAEAEFKKKEEETKTPIAEKEAAEKALTDAKAASTNADQAKKIADANAAKAAEVMVKAQTELEAARRAMDLAQKSFAEAEAAKVRAEEERKKAEDGIKSAKEGIAKAGEQVKKTKAPFDKAVAAIGAAKKTLESSERTAKRARDSVKKIADTVPDTEASVASAEEQHKQKQAVLEEVKKSAKESEKPYHAIAFAPDGLTLATGGEDQTVRTWDAETGSAIETYNGHEAAIHCVVYTPRGDVLSVAANNTAFVWDTNPDWKLARAIGSVDSDEQLVDRVTALDFSPDGKLLATGSGEPSRSGQLKIWSIEDGTLVRDIPEAHSDTIFGLEFSPDSKQIASCGADRFAKIFDVDSGEFVRSFEGHTHHVLGVSWRADGRLLATSGADNVVKVWDVRTGDQKRTIQGFRKEVTAIRFVADGDSVLVSSGDKSVQMKNTSNGGNVRSFPGASDFMYSVSTSGNGKVIAAGGQDSVLRLWKDDGKTLVNFEAPKEGSEPGAE